MKNAPLGEWPVAGWALSMGVTVSVAQKQKTTEIVGRFLKCCLRQLESQGFGV